MSDVLVAEGVALVDAGRRAPALTLRLLGGAGDRAALRAARRHAAPRARRPRAPSRARTPARSLAALSRARGYEPETRFNALHGDRRLIFHGPAGKLDVFVDAFEMCHRIELGGRLALDSPTLTGQPTCS